MILVLNCGSQSIKWKLFSEKLSMVKEGEVEVFNSRQFEQLLIKELENLKGQKFEIRKIGHRVVFGGTKFIKTTKITLKTIKELEKFNKIVPSHNPFNLLGIKKSFKLFGGVPQFAVFDTEFYSSLPDIAFTYSLPESIRKRFDYRKFGFHGISHEYAARQAAKEKFDKIKIISCHMGGGTSITAIKNGKAVDTSMGFGPTEGVIMMTRSGDVDNEIILEIAKRYGVEKTRKIINFESGFKGICKTGNMFEVLNKIEKGDKKSELALDIFVYQIKKYIGGYFAALGGCDLLVFTGAIGYGSAKITSMILQDMPMLKNTKISFIKPDEELAIAKKII